MKKITIIVPKLYLGKEDPELANSPKYEAKALKLAGKGNEITLAGKSSVWLYMRLIHTLSGKVKVLKYNSPLTGDIVIFDHSSP